MSGKFYLTCDIGTSVTKTVLYTDDFKTVSSSSQENTMKNQKACWLEEDPEQWWSSIKKGIAAVTKDIEPRNIIGIAACGQMHAPILVDKEGNALFSALSWPDSRTVKHVEKIREETGINQLYFTSTAPKILWIKQNYPEIIEKAYKIILPKDFIRMKLSESFCTDTNDAQGTGMYDSENKTWNWKLIDYIGLKHSQLPDVHQSNAIVGTTKNRAVSEANLVEGIPVITGTGDFYIGRRIESTKIEKHNLLIYLGTGPMIWWVSGDEPFSRRSRTTRSILGVAGTMPQWFKNNFFGSKSLPEMSEGKVFEYLDSKAAEIEPGSDGLIVLPHLMGERSYGGRTYSEEGKMNPYARGVFFGLCMGHSRYHIYRAILEGITYHLRLCWEHIKQQNQDCSSSLVVTTGGGAKSRIWRQIIADVFNLPVGRLSELETSTLGLACLTSVGIGKYHDFMEAASIAKNSVIDIMHPDPKNHELYTSMFRKYEKLEMSLEPLFTGSKY